MSNLLSLGAKFPEFKKVAVVSIEKGKEFSKINSQDHINEGKWIELFIV